MLVFPTLVQLRLASPMLVQRALVFRKLVQAVPAFPTLVRRQLHRPTKLMPPKPAWRMQAADLSDPAPPSIRRTFQPAADLGPCAKHVFAARKRG
jgi:hypothetical protein